MLRSVLRAGILFLFVFISLSSFSQSKWPTTLLWRISGKGLQKPSYLYGTMHLQDKRLFQFGDSLYHALEKTEGFAMEIDPSELMDSIMTNAVKEAEKDYLLSKQKVRLDRKKLDKSTDSLLSSFGIKGDEVTKKDLKKIRDRRTAKLLQQGEMPTIVDAYLLGLAKRMDKWTGGIEDVKDQLDLSDELGGTLEPQSVLMPEKLFKAAIEQMISVYLAQDLDKIEEISSRSFSAKDRDIVLINRNIKMAYRMDSLAHVRPMFFAVGAAHLPGNSGVITLLRNDGFTVEPVFPSAKLDAGSYAAKLGQQTWLTVEGDNNAYTVQMPGKASDYNMFGELVKMKMYFDMTTMSFYFSGSSMAKVSQDKLDELIQDMVSRMGGKKDKVKSKIIQISGISGKEAVAETDEANYRVQVLTKDNTLFLLMVGAMKKEHIHSADADRFFASFAPGNTVAEKKNWESFSLKGKAFSVNVPGTPTLSEAMDKQIEENSNWLSSSYQAVDPEKGAYYLVQVREMKDGFFLDGDSAYFQLLIDDYKSRADKILSTKVSTYQGYPALYMDGYLKSADAIYKTLHVVRGNRDYILIAGIPKDMDMSDVDRFLQSLQLLPHDAPEYKYQYQNGFFTKAPGAFKFVPRDSTESTKLFSEHYTVRNPVDIVSYDVFVQTFSPLYWIENDSTFFNRKLDQYNNEGDSIIKREWVQNGSLKGMEGVTKIPGYSSLRRVRIFVNGDTLYTLYSMIPALEINAKHHQEFFNEFRAVKEVAPTIYTGKVAQLLQALQNRDSLVMEDARENLGLVEFKKADLPLLHQALLKPYADGAGYESIKTSLIDIINRLADSSTVSFIEQNYASSKQSDPDAPYALLTVLAEMKTSQSYDLLKRLLLTSLPASGYANQLSGALFDSLSLTKTLFPEIMQHSADSTFGYIIATHANNLIDSNLLALTDILPYQSEVLKGAIQAGTKARRDNENSWRFGEWGTLVGRYDSEKGNALLRQMLTLKDPYVKQTIILALLKNNQSVNIAEIAKVAADKVQRIYFYDKLKELNKEKLFPTLYASQKSLAESELHNFISDEYTDDFTLTYVGERLEEYEGRKKRFHLFKLRMAYSEEDRKQTFLAIAGPYEINAKEKLVSGSATGFYTGEELNPAKIGKLLKAYLQDLKPAEE